MRRFSPFIAVLLLCGGLFCLAQAQIAQTGAGLGKPTVVGCSQATTYLARTSGENTTAITNYICGLVTDGLITGNLTSTGCGSVFDVLYIFASQNSTDALLNVCSNANFNGTIPGSVTFTANTGFTGSGAANSWVDTGFNPVTATSPNYVQNSAHISVWISADSGSAVAAIGSIYSSPAVDTSIFINFSGSNTSYWRINDLSAAAGIAEASFTGHYLSNRSGTSVQQGYHNAVDQGVVSGTSNAPANQDILAVGANTNLSVGASYNGTEMIVSIGASMTPTQVTNFCHRTNLYLTAVAGVSGGIC